MARILNAAKSSILEKLNPVPLVLIHGSRCYSPLLPRSFKMFKLEKCREREVQRRLPTACSTRPVMQWRLKRKPCDVGTTRERYHTNDDLGDGDVAA